MRWDHRVQHDDVQCVTPARWSPVGPLGNGTFGDVHMFETQLGPHENARVALKRVKGVFDSGVHLRRAIRELRIMNHLRGHPNIVVLVDADLVVEDPHRGLYFYQEVMDLDLATVLRHPQEALSEWHAPFIAYQMLCGVYYMHSANVVHRDLKPSNILVTRYGAVKICDFGLARGLAHDTYDRERYTDYVTTRWYRAPEIIMRVERYHYGLDMWAVGCIMAELVQRKPLFRGANTLDQFRRIAETLGRPPIDWFQHLRPSLDEHWRAAVDTLPGLIEPLSPLRMLMRDQPPELLDLLEGILVYRPDERLTAAQALRSHYFDAARDFGEPERCPAVANTDFEDAPDEALRGILEQEVRRVKDQLQP